MVILSLYSVGYKANLLHALIPYPLLPIWEKGNRLMLSLLPPPLAQNGRGAGGEGDSSVFANSEEIR